LDAQSHDFWNKTRLLRVSLCQNNHCNLMDLGQSRTALVDWTSDVLYIIFIIGGLDYLALHYSPAYLKIHPFTRPMAFRTFRTMAFQLASLEPAPGAVTG